MPHFLVFGLDHPPHSMAARDAARAEHRAYVMENDSPIRLAGAMIDADDNQCGSIYSFEAESAEQVQEWLAREPFVKGGIYESIRVVQWSPALNRLPAMEWKKG
jgi:hypothetical protein